MDRLLAVAGWALVLGGVGHSLGVGRLYLTEGTPGLLRVLVDIWVAEAQLITGLVTPGALSWRVVRGGWRPWPARST